MHPNPKDYAYDLDRALTSVVGLRSHVPEDAFTAEVLGTEREGSGVFIRRNGLVVTIGYLVMEAETVWLSLHDKRVVPGHVLGFDPETGFGLVQALAREEFPHLDIGRSADLTLGDRAVLAGAGELGGALATHVVARQEFAGYWEYLIGDALFTAPAHSHWGGTALIDRAGRLVGIGSLSVQHESRGQTIDLNMVVPIDLLTPILDDLATLGQARRPPRPWLGLYARDLSGRVLVLGVASRGPAAKAAIVPGDVVVAVGERRVDSLAGFFRAVWALGEAGVDVPLTIQRNGESLFVRVRSVDRRRLLKGPVLH
jgi:S1-C subfamily serine protease